LSSTSAEPHHFPAPRPDAADRLATLTATVARQRHTTAPRPWARARPGADHTVAIVGAGQAGLAVAAGLTRRGVTDLVVLDAAREGHTGPWPTVARMRTLRTAARAPWPDWDVPAAAPHPWYEAKFGDLAWAALDRFPTGEWHAFLQWYRHAMAVPVRYRTPVHRLTPDADGVTVTTGDGATLRAERVVLATGLEGAGGSRVPPRLFDALPRHRWAHTHEPVDFTALRGARIGILGGGTGAFDNAATALEAGAATATVHMRRDRMPEISPYRWMEFPAILEHYAALTDDHKWRFNDHLATVDQPATDAAVARAHALPGFAFRTGSAWLDITEHDGDLLVRTTGGTERYDFVLAATGVTVDLARRRELAHLAPDIALWRDRYTPPAPAAHPQLLDHPYLDDRFGLQPRCGGPHGLDRIHLFNHGARLSLGILGHQISGLAGGAGRLVTGITAALVGDRSADLLHEFVTHTAAPTAPEIPR
jgi:FAD-dependent urate hydroxylase